MANFVTKKDGTRVAFDLEKIKTGIKFAATEAGLSEEEAGAVASEVADLVTASFEGIEEVPTTEIRDKVLSELDTLHPSVAQAWRHYEEGKHE